VAANSVVANDTAERARHLQTVLRSVHLPETFLFPGEDDELIRALPAGVADEDDLVGLESFAILLRRLFDLRTLPIDDLTLTLADQLFAGGEFREADLAIAYQIASLLRQWRETQPEWRLPELTAQLQQAVAGQRSLGVIRSNDLGYDPVPGRITLSTQHSAKGLEWDAVYLVGIDGQWIPGSLESRFRGDYDAYGDDLRAEAVAQLRYLMAGEPGLYDGRNATESAHIEVICERLRLLYVGITRARRFLQISRSRSTRQSGADRDTEPATVLGVLYRYLQNQQQ
jgi:DNA helicase-2/ATP-dependent DNA helicase PcrA